ncbi:MAG: 50S ribosomal protein L5 [Candidatus Pacebacteria bacterium]|nr:50S ribosomal protein L5 [Candidatus Paceibacterota bacterium]MBP9840174.1 50S ribosomal protein L5 [Candidatus Paceibacterota bacterium]
MMQTKERVKGAFRVLGEELGVKNVMAAPRVEKVVVSSGVGKKRDKKVLELIENRITRITGQKPSARPARLSIASFKVREGDVVGYQVTLRGARMYDFLDRLIHVALPRTRDFRGLTDSAIDEMGNMTIGIKEHTIFPETSDEEVKDVFGLAVTIVTSAKDKKSATAFLKHLGLPIRSK